MSRLSINVELPDFIKVMRSMFETQQVHLRELVQNSIEAIYQAEQSDSPIQGKIEITTDPDGTWLKVIDNGIGMTREQMIENLTYVFRSGWPKEKEKTLGIGQFGFGFFSVFLVADYVRVVSRSRSSSNQVCELIFDIAGDFITVSNLSDNQYSPGTMIEVHLRKDERYGTNTDYIVDHLKEIYLYAPYKIYVNNVIVPLPTKEGWRNAIEQPGRAASMDEWVQQRYGWNTKPLHIAPLNFDNGGWLVIPPSSENRQSFEVYRKGIRVSREELLIPPLNMFICGLIDVDEINLKPDRETLRNDKYYERLQLNLFQAAIDALINLAETSDRQFNLLFEHYGQALRVAIAVLPELRKHLGLYYPLESFWVRNNEKSVTIQSIIAESFEKSLYWILDPSHDRFFAERCMYLGKNPVIISRKEEQNFVKAICDEHHIKFIHVAQAYFDEIESNIYSVPALEALFSSVIDPDYITVCWKDLDTRYPVVLINAPVREHSKFEESKDIDIYEFFDALLSELHPEEQREITPQKILVINLRNQLIIDLERKIILGTEQELHKRIAKILVFIARTLANDVKSSEEFAVFAREVLITISDQVTKN